MLDVRARELLEASTRLLRSRSQSDNSEPYSYAAYAYYCMLQSELSPLQPEFVRLVKPFSTRSQASIFLPDLTAVNGIDRHLRV